ncbi:glycolate oxidase subunit GlcF [Lacisediminimonas sp.]|uniref:glycolate oxidase subunit GlcF n=1 Tax=Lacisediminimonas sp. TaxID=3060582 RepID=UPI002721FFF6|nr:glycolate oxidase subunit GlcF [Lacisediminimonas sp.]MDO8299810.1 glycolate oxidase subunit GlcF [Lacisediminimonas sp.]
MQTNLADFIKDTPEGREADAILRACVHCGFCTATCPTYQLFGDELDGPRGRIYLMKRVLEGEAPTRRTQLHLDRCLTCRNCETTCPSGVQYGRLVDIGRKVVDDQVARPLRERVVRSLLKEVLPRRWLFSPAMKVGQALRPLLPQSLRNKVPARQQSGAWPVRQHARTMLMLEGCVQPSMSPNTNTATARVLDALGIGLIRAPGAGCCGAIRHHLNDHDGALDDLRRNIDAWWPHVEAGAEAIVVNASGCGVMVKDYGKLLAADPQYGERARKISELARDIAEVLHQHKDALRELVKAGQRDDVPVAWHPPCTLQHGQKIRGVVEEILRAAGVDVKLCADSHLCCGSAGTYSVLLPEIATQLRDDKLRKLDATGAKRIVSANIGCVTHLQSGTDKPVEHWIELVDRMIA